MSYDKYTGEVPCHHACTGSTRPVLRHAAAERTWGCRFVLAWIQVCLVASTLDQHSSKPRRRAAALHGWESRAAQLHGWAAGQLQKPRMSPSATPAWPAAAACACSVGFGEQSDDGPTQQGRKSGDSCRQPGEPGRMQCRVQAGGPGPPASKNLGSVGADVSLVLLCPSVLLQGAPAALALWCSSLPRW